MAKESEWISKSYITMLWGSRGWQDLYKVGEYSLGTMSDVDK